MVAAWEARVRQGKTDSSAPAAEIPVHVDLVQRLRARRQEIERAIFTRVRTVSEGAVDEDPSYLEGLQRAAAAAITYGFECMEQGEDWQAPIPPATGRQARRAAREGVRLDTVLRRYAAGDKVIEEFLVDEADDIPSESLRRILGDRGPHVDRLMEAVAAEYEHEFERMTGSSAKKRTDRVLRLLAGSDGIEGYDELQCDFDDWHTGLIVTGRDADSAAHRLIQQVGLRALQVTRDDDIAWVWLESSRRPSVEDLVGTFASHLPATISLAIGEPRRGLDGWRLTHREAQIALQVMQHKPERVTRGRDVTLLAGVLKDETLVRSLLDSYLVPLDERGNRGVILRQTLRAFFLAGGNAASAAEQLGVDRHTVRQRIRAIEEAIGKPLHACHAELQIALRLDALDHPPAGADG
jgi:PucR C-terminal helix-turn-helix domain/GGDEF-like domain